MAMLRRNRTYISKILNTWSRSYLRIICLDMLQGGGGIVSLQGKSHLKSTLSLAPWWKYVSNASKIMSNIVPQNTNHRFCEICGGTIRLTRESRSPTCSHDHNCQRLGQSGPRSDARYLHASKIYLSKIPNDAYLLRKAWWSYPSQHFELENFAPTLWLITAPARPASMIKP